MRKFFANLKNNKFFKGAIILAIAGIICRGIGVAFRIPLANIVGNYGIGLYQLVFPLYSFLLIVSSSGIPVAISRMVARAHNDNDKVKAKQILFNAVLLLTVIGLLITVLFFVFSGTIARAQGNESIGSVYMAIAPSVVLVCVMSALRGYFQGYQNMTPTAVSQIIEQLIKLGAGLGLAALWIKKSVEMAVFGSILAVSISELIALIYLVFHYLKHKKKEDAGAKPQKTKFKPDLKIVKEIIKTALPITAMASIFPLLLMFDSMVVVNMLSAAGESGRTATELYGISSGAVHTLTNLPSVISVAVATCIVPMATSHFHKGEFKEMQKKSVFAILAVLVMSAASAIIYFFFADFILNLLYSGAFKDRAEQFDIAVKLLKIESILVVFMCLTQVLSSILQGVGKLKIPLFALLAGGVAKVLIEIFFIKTDLGINAVSFANIACFLVALLVNLIFVIITFNHYKKNNN
ncbi:MAG: polysaccharide biosynthesis protein [Christensenellaceae bacterium]|jgi:stage V sporulation protein B|nr:polysaccharide biosynthesis protein [Christensenellaceae bacterium]